MRDINIKAIEYFESVARLGSVTRSAEELGVSPPAVSQQIRSLEAQFGVRLFRREKRRLLLTQDGDILFQTATQAFGALRNVRSAVLRQRDQRSFVIRVSPSFGVSWLGPRILSFLADNPDWNMRVDAKPDFTAFETEPVDLDLRYGRGGWAGLTVDFLMNDLVLPLCSPDYRSELRNRSDDPAEMLALARLIDSARALCRWDVWLATNRITLPEVNYPLRFDRSSMTIELARQGGGVALENANLCLGELRRGELVPLSPHWPVIDEPAYWLVCPSRHFNRRIVSRFADWIAGESARHEAETRATLADLGCSFAGDV
ncbi:LysR family transcriptional regulator [Sulfitobacter sp. LCG007]